MRPFIYGLFCKNNIWVKSSNKLLIIYWTLSIPKMHEKPICRGNCLKRGAWTVCRFKGDLAKKRERVFLRQREGWYPNAQCCEFFSTSCKDFPDKNGLIPPTKHVLAWYKISSNLLLLRNFPFTKKCMKSPRYKMTSLNSSGLIQIVL